MNFYSNISSTLLKNLIFRNGEEIEVDRGPETEVQEEINVIEVRHVMPVQDQSQNHVITSEVQVGRVVSVGGVQADRAVIIAVQKLIYVGPKRIFEALKWICPIAIAKMVVAKITAIEKLIRTKSFQHFRVLLPCTWKTYRCQHENFRSYTRSAEGVRFFVTEFALPTHPVPIFIQKKQQSVHIFMSYSNKPKIKHVHVY